MNNAVLYIVLLHAVALAGGLLAKRLRVPAGALLGSLAAAAVLNIAIPPAAAYPAILRLIVQVIAGAAIGQTFTRDDVRTLHRLIKPAAILVSMLAAFNILFALIISRLTEFDVITALFATAPGGVADIALIAADFGADTQQVAVLQIFRFVLVVLLFPPIVRKIIKTNPQLQSDFPAPNESGVPKVSAKKQAPRKQILKIIATLCTASAGAALARLAGIPAGALIGSLTATIALGTIVQAAYLPKWTRRAVQIFAGCFIGSKITLATLAYFQHLLVPMALIVVQLLAMTFGTAYMLRRFGSMDRATSLFSSIPGGFAEMTLIAQEMGLRVPEIVFLNTCRIISVVALMPVLLFLFTKFL